MVASFLARLGFRGVSYEPTVQRQPRQMSGWPSIIPPTSNTVVNGRLHPRSAVRVCNLPFQSSTKAGTIVEIEFRSTSSEKWHANLEEYMVSHSFRFPGE